MKHIAENGIQTENDLVDIPQQRKGYSEDFDLWETMRQVDDLKRRMDNAVYRIRYLESRVLHLEGEVAVLNAKAKGSGYSDGSIRS